MTVQSAGEKPGPGKYFCMKCREKIEITAEKQALPVCPRCGHTEYLKMIKP